MVKLCSRICQNIEIFVADAASVEMKAGELLQDVLPGLKLIIRDRPHATRRLTKRPWAADAFLDAVVKIVVLQQKSICQ